MAATVPTHKSASFSQPRLPDWKHTQAVLRELAALLPSQINGIFWWWKEESSFWYRIFHSIRTPREKGSFLPLQDICSPPFSSFLRELPQYLGSWGLLCTLERADARELCWPRPQRKWCNLGKSWRGNKSSSVWLWRLIWLMTLFSWLCVRMFPYPCCMKSKMQKRDRKVGKGVFCKVKTDCLGWFKLPISINNQTSSTTGSSLTFSDTEITPNKCSGHNRSWSAKHHNSILYSERTGKYVHCCF